MNTSHVIFLNSETSKNCHKIRELIKQYGISVSKVDIDNEKIREQVLNSKTMSVKQVPCILVVFSNGTVEKYEANDAFNWVIKKGNELISARQPLQIAQPYVPSQIIDQNNYKVQNIQQNIQQHIQQQPDEFQENIDLEEEEEQIIPIQEKPDKPQKPKKKYVPQSVIKKKSTKQTDTLINIEDLSSEDEQGSVFSNSQEDDSDKKVKNSAIMAAAAALQKDREES